MEIEKQFMLKINVGCGYGWSFPGWIGIDWDETSFTWKQEGDTKSYINVNVLEGLPFQDESIDAVYCSHMLEHFTYFEAIQVMSEFYRVLKPGAVLSLVVPDLDTYLERLAIRDEVFLNTPDIIGGNPRDNLTDNFLMNFYSDPSFNNSCHKYAYNKENLSLMLQRFHFEGIHFVDFQHFTFCEEVNKIEFKCKAEHADQFSLSVEAVKKKDDWIYQNEPFYLESKETVDCYLKSSKRL